MPLNTMPLYITLQINTLVYVFRNTGRCWTRIVVLCSEYGNIGLLKEWSEHQDRIDDNKQPCW